MQSQRCGIEIEMTGLTRRSAALIIAKHFDTGFRHERGVYDTYSVCDQDGRKWKIVRDASITPQCGNRFDYDPDYKVEVVSPICHYEDIETIQSIVRELRRNGHAKVNESCGIHIHVDASKHTARSLRNIANIMYSKEDLIFKALKVRPQREVRFCKKIDDDFLEMLNRKKPKDIEEVENLWYDGNTSRKYEHYDDSRYHALNFHSVFSKGTIEFRMFNGTLHAGEIKTYIQFCLAISHQALVQNKASRVKTHSSNEKYTFRTWLLRLGLIGDEFKTARHHLLKNLDGCIAWKDPQQAVMQRERLQSAQETNNESLEDVQEELGMHMQQM